MLMHRREASTVQRIDTVQHRTVYTDRETAEQGQDPAGEEPACPCSLLAPERNS